MRIAWLLNTFPSESETFIARDIHALRARGHVVDVWALRAGNGAQQVPRLPMILRAFPAEAARMRGRHWAHECRNELQACDWLHAGWANFLADSVQVAAHGLQLPWSFSAHARDLWVEGGDLKKKLSSAQFAFCCTRAGSAHLRALSLANAAKVIDAPHGLPEEWFAPMPAWAPSGEMRIVSVGRLVPKKGFMTLLDALVWLHSGGVAARWELVGDGPQMGNLQLLTKSLHFSDRVTFHGARSPDWVRDFLREASGHAVFVLPAQQEMNGDRDGLPNVLLEAAACGVPIVTTRAGSISDAFDFQTARIVEAGNPEMLAKTIKHVFTDTNTTQKRRLVAYTRVREQFSLQRTIEAMASALESSH